MMDTRALIAGMLTLGLLACDDGGGEDAARDGGGGAADTGRGPLDGGPGDAGPELDELLVFPLAPRTMDADRVATLARALGLEGDVVTDDRSFVVSDLRFGPPGPVAAQGVGGTLRAGSLIASLDPACANEVDDDGDGQTDALDEDCEHPEDASEEAPGFQRPETPDAVVRLEGRYELDGTLTVASAAFPVVRREAEGRTLGARLALVAEGVGRIDPLADESGLTLPLELEVTCEGAGCFDTCSIDLGATEMRPTEGYRPFDGVWSIEATPAPDVAGCPEAAAAIGLPDGPVEIQMALRLTPTIRPIATALTVERTHGVITYQTPDELLAVDVPTLPDDDAATAGATAFLEAHDLMPPGATARVLRLSRSDADGRVVEYGAQVSFDVHLPVSPGDPERLVHLDGVHVEVTLGHEGRVLGLRHQWQPLGDPIVAPSRGRRGAIEDIQRRFPDETIPDDIEITLRQIRAGAFVEPVFVAAPRVADPGASGAILGLAPATLFAPKIAGLEPTPGATVEAAGAGTVSLSVDLVGGEAPYAVTWRSDLQGELGSGESIEAPLADGLHVVTVDIRDAAGAGVPISYALEVSGSGAPPAVDDGQRRKALVDLTQPFHVSRDGSVLFNLARGPHGGGIAVSNLRRGGNSAAAGMQTFLEKFYLEQWRYAIELELPGGGTFRLISDKCVPGDIQGGACLRPRPPFAVVSVNDPISSPGRGLILTDMEITRLPGTFRLKWLYQFDDVVNFACNPPGVFTEFDLFVATQAFTFGTELRASALAGRCPAMIPEVRWTYEPPVTAPFDGIPAGDVLDFCLAVDPEGAGVPESPTRDVLEDPLDLAPVGDPMVRDADIERARVTRAADRRLAVSLDTYGTWPPSDELFSWFVLIELADDDGRSLGSAVVQYHDGTRSQLVQGLPRADVKFHEDVNGPTITFDPLPEGATQYAIQSGVLPTPRGARTTDEVAPGRLPAVGDRRCGLTEAQRESLRADRGRVLKVNDFRAVLYTAVVPHASGQENVSNFLKDTQGLMAGATFDTSIGDRYGEFQPFLFSIATDLHTQLLPMDVEQSAVIARPDGTGDFDNYHAKASLAPDTSAAKPPRGYVSYPGCNSIIDPGDVAPCVHVHDAWPKSPFDAALRYSKNQDVRFLSVADHPAEHLPRQRPDFLIDGETLYRAGTADADHPFIGDGRFDQMMWHKSFASSKVCGSPAASVDNRLRPCRVFRSPMFFTH